jgi:hypothetical protein
MYFPGMQPMGESDGLLGLVSLLVARQRIVFAALGLS